jgi:hypothetical protein
VQATIGYVTRPLDKQTLPYLSYIPTTLRAHLPLNSIASIRPIRERTLIIKCTIRLVPRRRRLWSRIIQQERCNSVCRQGERHITHGRPVVRVAPYVVDTILSPGANGPGFSQVEEHLSGVQEGVEDHKRDAVGGVAAPVLRGVRGIRGVVGVDAQAEGGDGCADVRVLVDFDEVFVA